MIAGILIALSISTIGPSDTPAWRESFLVLGTGRAPYRSVYAEASARLGADLPGSARWMGSVADPAGTRDWLVLQRVASDVGEIAGPAFASALDAAPDDTSAWAIVIALAATRDRGSAPAVAARIASPDRRLRAAVVVALGDLARAEEIPALARALTDSAPSVRRAAAAAFERLARRDTPSAWPASLREEARSALEAAARNPDPWTRRNARRALDLLPPPAPPVEPPAASTGAT